MKMRMVTSKPQPPYCWAERWLIRRRSATMMYARFTGGDSMQRSLVVLILLFWAAPVAAAELHAGAAAVIITPPEGTPLAGYYSPRGSKTVLDHLYSKALVLEQDGVKVALVVCDLIAMPRRTTVEARKLIAKETGIPGTHVMISATHTHTGPVLVRDASFDEAFGATTDLAQRYSAQLPELIARSVSEANRKLAPARLSAALGKEENLSFNRRFF